MSDVKPVISVILVVYNAISYIEGAIQNLVEKTTADCEIVIMDGGSTDGTQEVLNKHKEQIDVLVMEKDKGIYDAMNKGIRNASGRYLYFIGVDDRLLVNLSEVITHLKNDNTVYYGDVLLDKQNKIYDGPFTAAKLVRRNICHQAMFYPAKVFEKYLYDMEFKTLADYVFNIRLWGDKNFTFEYIPLTIARYCEQGISSTYVERKFTIYAFKAIYRHLGLKYLLLKFLNPFLRN